MILRYPAIFAHAAKSKAWPAPDDGNVRAEIATFDEFWQCQVVTGLLRTKTGYIGDGPIRAAGLVAVWFSALKTAP